MNLVDVHVLVLPSSNKEWLEQCLNSLKNEPCNVHVVEGIDGALGKSRVIGYSQGTAPFVSHVDCDDYVLPGVINTCLAEMTAEDKAVVCREHVLYSDGQINAFCKDRHHLLISRRSAIEPLYDTIGSIHYSADKYVMESLKPRQLSCIGYVWRVHGGGMHNAWKNFYDNTPGNGSFYASAV